MIFNEATSRARMFGRCYAFKAKGALIDRLSVTIKRHQRTKTRISLAGGGALTQVDF